MWVGLQEQITFYLASEAYCSLQNLGYLDLTRPTQIWKHPSSSSPLKSFHLVMCVVLTLKLGGPDNGYLIIYKDTDIDNGCECGETTSCSLENIPRRQRSIKDVPKCISRASISKHVLTRRLSNLPNICSIPSMFTASFVPDWQFKAASRLVLSSHKRGRKHLLIGFGPVSV